MTYPKVSREISNPVNENIQKLAALFPSAVKDGELDVEALKQELGDFTEVGPEKYELTWAGKQRAKQTAFEPIIGKTLKYIPEESKPPDTTENLFVEGDNLEVLKLLRQNYYGAVKMIYIDPPYNTGNDFIYNDNFRMSKVESDIAEGNMSEIGERYTKNRKDHNRYHTIWLNMISSRLRIARDLLRDDGVIFISINDNEVASLRKLCDEIFGEDNFVTTTIWEKADSPRNSARQFSEDHDYTNINWLREDLRGGDLFDHYDKNASDKDKLDFTPGFTDLDVVYEIMLRQTDIPLSSRVELGQRTYLFADSFLVCLEIKITRDLVDRLAAIEPLPIKFIFRDSAFDDDIALKDETFRTLNALTERNSGGQKQTYIVEFI